MRLLIMADAFGTTGGGEVMVAYLARQLRERHEVAILTAGDGQTEQSTWEGIPVFQIHSAYHPRLRPALSILNPATVGPIRRAMSAFRPDVVHAWNVHHHLGYEALRIATRMAPVIHTSQDALAFCYTKFHCWIDPTAPPDSRPEPRAHPERCRNCRAHYWLFPIRNRLVRAYLGSAVRIPVSVSHALAAALETNGLRRPRVVYNGIPADDFQIHDSSGESEHGRLGTGEGPAVLAGGRLGHFKGHEQALRAFATVAPAIPGAQLLIMGGFGWYGERLTNIAADLGVSDRVRFLGLVPRKEVPVVLSRSRAVLNLSMYLDPFPTMNLEAMAASRAVIGTCFGGTPEAVVNGQTGHVVNPYDEAGVAQRIREVLTDEVQARALGHAGRARLEERFLVEQMAMRYEEIYQEAVGAQGSGLRP